MKRAFVDVLQARLMEKSPLIQVILGPRQVGKTTGVGMLSLDSDKTHYCTADEALNLTIGWLSDQWQQAKRKSETPILIIDEVQKIMHWSERIKFLWDEEKRKKTQMRLVLLGSSSLSLSQGLEESLAGRFETIQVPHWNYQECRQLFHCSLDEYLVYGGYPEAFKFRNKFDRWKAYLKGSIIETVIGKDILRIAQVRKPALFRQCFELISAYPAQEISYNKILGQLQEGGNVDLVKYYITLFEGAFLFKSISKYSGSIIRTKTSSPKIIPLCPALVTHQFSHADLQNESVRGRIFEALIGATLSRLDGELYYWREGDYEVDYVFKHGRQLYAIEVKTTKELSSYKPMEVFISKYKQAIPVYLTLKDYPQFERDPMAFMTG